MCACGLSLGKLVDSYKMENPMAQLGYIYIVLSNKQRDMGRYHKKSVKLSL